MVGMKRRQIVLMLIVQALSYSLISWVSEPFRSQIVEISARVKILLIRINLPGTWVDDSRVGSWCGAAGENNLYANRFLVHFPFTFG